MTLDRLKTIRLTSPAPVAATALAATLMLPSSSPAFFQQTRLEGVVGADIGGIWLSVQHVMPEFRITFPRPVDGSSAVPVKVGPIPADLVPVTGTNPAGVSIQDCGGTGFCSDNGLVVGDILYKVNATEISDVASFEKAIAEPPPTVLLWVRRPALRMSTTRLLKIKYDREGRETDEGSVEHEKLDLKVLDVQLPFAEAVEATRQSHAFFVPSAAELEKLAKTWSDLRQNDPFLLFKGDHRFVSRSSYDEALAKDVSLRKASHAIVMDMDGNPIHGGGKVIDIYGFETIGKDAIDGTYVTVTIASAPFPINVEFKGRFHMTRLGPWSDEDDQKRAAAEKRPPSEDLNKFKTLPDVPPPAGKK
jgi:hypothetical protein